MKLRLYTMKMNSCYTEADPTTAMKYINTTHFKTNYEGIIGKIVRITQDVDNISATGAAVVNGQEWTVRSTQDDILIPAGSLAKVVSISGVKLIVEKYEEEKVQ